MNNNDSISNDQGTIKVKREGKRITNVFDFTRSDLFSDLNDIPMRDMEKNIMMLISAWTGQTDSFHEGGEWICQREFARAFAEHVADSLYHLFPYMGSVEEAGSWDLSHFDFDWEYTIENLVNVGVSDYLLYMKMHCGYEYWEVNDSKITSFLEHAYDRSHTDPNDLIEQHFDYNDRDIRIFAQNSRRPFGGESE